MTAVSAINSDINLDNLYKNAIINDVLTFIHHGSLGTKGESNKKVRKHRIPKKQKSFFNQVTIHVNCDKIVNVKLFNNGKIQMTGLKYEKHGEKVLDTLLPYILQLDSESPAKIFNQSAPIIYNPFNIALINSDFSIGYKVKRDIVHREIVDSGMYSSYEPCIYPGVNIKYYYNKDSISQYAGICKCNKPCIGKGCGEGDGNCKKITIVVFMSGQVMITGARSREHLTLCYNFITNFLNSKKELFTLRE